MHRSKIYEITDHALRLSCQPRTTQGIDDTMLQQRYRKEYDGEFVIIETVIANGQKSQTREWIANPIENQHISGRAAVIGSDWDLEFFKFERLQRHRGGIRGSKRLQTYGTGNIWQYMKLDFYASTNQKQLTGIAKNLYHESTVVYASANDCIRRPGSFYIVPYVPTLCDLTLPVYLAAFDGHQEVFLLGYHLELDTDQPWIKDLDAIISTYDATNFIWVGRVHGIPDIFKYRANFRQMEYRTWISYCDV